MAIKFLKGGNPLGSIALFSGLDLTDEGLEALADELEKNTPICKDSRLVLVSNYDITLDNIEGSSGTTVFVCAEDAPESEVVLLREHIEAAEFPEQFSFVVSNTTIQWHILSPFKA